MTGLLPLLRDLTALAAGLVLVLAAAVFWSGAAGAGLGALAVTTAAAALGGAASLTLSAAASAFGIPSVWALALVGALCVVGAFVAGLGFGVRGLWLALAAGGGAALGLVLLALFDRAGLGGPAAPAAGLAALLAVASGALAAAAEPGAAQGRPDLARLTTPPPWFDCLYASLGGTALAPGKCAYAPPDAAVGLAALSASPAMMASPPAESPPRPDLLTAATPPIAAAPEPPASAAFDAAPPSFASAAQDPVASRAGGGVPVSAPGAPQPPAGAGEGPSAAPRDTRAAPPPPLEPAPPIDPARRPIAPAPEAAPAPASLADLSAVPVAAAPPPPLGAGPSAPPARPAADERRRTTHVCFPLLGADVERLCPDRRLDASTVEAHWSLPGGEARAGVGPVECHIDRDAPSHAVLVVAPPSDPARPLSRGDGRGGALGSGAAFYEAAARLVWDARTRDGLNHLAASAYFIGAGPLAGPWASQDFGAGRSDRVFSLASSGESLALLRRFRAETQTSKPALTDAVFAEAVAAAAAERPEPTHLATHVGQTLLVALIDARRPLPAADGAETGDAAAAAAFDVGQVAAAAAAEAASAAGAALFIVAVTEDGAPPAGLAQLAERAGGSAHGVSDLASLADALDRVMLRARAFCAVRLTAPARFFDAGPVEISVARRGPDGCGLRQTATLSCGSISLDAPTPLEALLAP